MDADWNRYTLFPAAVNLDPAQPGSQSPQAPPVASLCKLPTRLTEAGAGVWSARTFPVGLNAAKELKSMAVISTILDIVLLAFIAQLLY
jgi:hypothetical protein